MADHAMGMPCSGKLGEDLKDLTNRMKGTIKAMESSVIQQNSGDTTKLNMAEVTRLDTKVMDQEAKFERLRHQLAKDGHIGLPAACLIYCGTHALPSPRYAQSLNNRQIKKQRIYADFISFMAGFGIMPS